MKILIFTSQPKRVFITLEEPEIGWLKDLVGDAAHLWPPEVDNFQVKMIETLTGAQDQLSAIQKNPDLYHKSRPERGFLERELGQHDADAAVYAAYDAARPAPEQKPKEKK